MPDEGPAPAYTTLRQMAERLWADTRAGRRQQGDRTVQVPVGRYLDADWFAGERRHLFGSAMPLCMGHVCELPEPGSVLRFDAAGHPLLVVRDRDGALHGVLNVCRHRGMRLVEEPACRRPTLTCPYHGWTYELDGRLRHVPFAEAFDERAQPGEFDLVRFPVAERAGLIFGAPRPGATMDLDAWLGPVIGDLAWMGIPESVLFRRIETERACNWKLVIEAFMEAYHIRVLHRDSIYPFFLDAQAGWDMFGPHQRMIVARRRCEQEPDPWSDDRRQVRKLWTYSHLVFPNLIVIAHPDYVSAISLWPIAPDRTRWSHAMLIPREKSTPDWMPHWEKTLALMEQRVFQKEDLHAAEGIQSGIASGANRHMTFGRLEPLLGAFHEHVRAAVEA